MPVLIYELLIMVLGAWLAMWPAGWLIAALLKSKKEVIQPPSESDQAAPARGFPDGGAIIGRLERLLIYCFVLSGQLGAVGFLVAAKSIFRFGELSNQQNRLEAEYITIGTLMSFTTGMLIALGIRTLVEIDIVETILVGKV